ncbi:uncharacterized protein LOC134741814 [Cydia strobilella]|uniref:uncharacterized protein LOC134741814 n=1 Tax=Cydia strobilella TaxID=1100964 RepID=UPI0030060A6B
MLRFRENKIGVTGDIKDMFLRIKIRVEDQNALRFLWRDNPTDALKTYVMTSLPFGANCSPFVSQFIKNLKARRFESTMPDAVDAICNSHYVDDYIDSFADETAAIKMVRNINLIHSAGGFEMRNWTSNSVSVLNSLPNQTLGTAAVRFKVDQQQQGERTLGLIWYPADDKLTFDLSLKRIPESIVNGDERPTKRLMLRVIMSIFDILGFLSPFTIQGRIMLQDTWRLNIDWNDYIPDVIYNKWRKWIDLLQVISDIRIPRCYQSAVRNHNHGDDESPPVRVSETADHLSGASAGTPSATLPLSTFAPGNVAPTSCATKVYESVAEPTSATRTAKSDAASPECVAVVHEGSIGLAVPDPLRFSSWLRLKRATATVLAFIDRCKGLQGQVDCGTMERAERLLIQHAQAESFGKDIVTIKNGKPLHRTSRLVSLSPVFDEHSLLRVSGRIDAVTDVPIDVKRPVILDGRHQVSKLIVRDYHVKLAHGNQETIVNEVKQRFWILRLRPTVKFIASSCMLCRIRKCQPRIPRMGDLPRARMAHHQRAFSYCGLDLFGPMEVVVGRRREKRYGVLYTCLTVRAIHIELVSSLTSDSLIMSLRRMAARRGWPSHLFSDNGTNLRGACTELQRSMQELNAEELKSYGANKGMEWTFIPPASPHWGGAWERLIRSVKTSLKVILNERAPRDEVLSTLMAEVENIVNCRPLMHVSVENGGVESLTPNHFLLGTSSNLPTIGSFDGSDLYLRKHWRTAQRLTDMFWQRWLKEILPDLIPRRKWHEERKPLQVGDLVLVVDPNSPRNMWPKGLVTQVFAGKDGRIRLVEVKTRTGTWRRSAARIAPISLVD